MRVRSDDDIYRARLVYLGPPGYPLPVQLPYAEYLLFLVLAVVFVAVAAAVTGTWESSMVAVAAAVFTTGGIWRHVDADTPARKVIKVALTDWRRITPPPDRLPRLTARHIRVVAPPARPADLAGGDRLAAWLAGAAGAAETRAHPTPTRTGDRR
jgi:hypothetical protein